MVFPQNTNVWIVPRDFLNLHFYYSLCCSCSNPRLCYLFGITRTQKHICLNNIAKTSRILSLTPWRQSHQCYLEIYFHRMDAEARHRAQAKFSAHYFSYPWCLDSIGYIPSNRKTARIDANRHWEWDLAFKNSATRSEGISSIILWALTCASSLVGTWKRNASRSLSGRITSGRRRANRHCQYISAWTLKIHWRHVWNWWPKLVLKDQITCTRWYEIKVLNINWDPRSSVLARPHNLVRRVGKSWCARRECTLVGLVGFAVQETCILTRCFKSWFTISHGGSCLFLVWDW